MASNEQVAIMFAAFQANWNKETITPEQMALYARLLVDIPDNVLEAATLDILATATWFPKIAEIRATAMRIMEGPSQLPTAGEAWGEVRKQLLRVGSGLYPNITVPEWGQRRFSHPLIEEAIKAFGGWRAICNSTDDQEMADRAHFMKIYDQLAARAEQRARMLPEVRRAIAQIDASKPKELEAGE